MNTGIGHRVQSGDRLEGIPAATWNSFVDAAAWVRSQRNVSVSADQWRPTPGGTVKIRNDSGADVERFGIMKLNGVVISREENSRAFKNQPVLIGEATGTPPQTFVVAQRPILEDKIGLCMIAGVTPVQIDVIEANDEWADVISADSTKLRSQPFGSAKILYKEAGTGTKWGYVLLGAGPMMLIGKTNASHAKAASGTINVYRGTTKGSEAFSSSITVTAWNRFGAVDSGKWVMCAYVQGWELISAEC